MKTKWILLVLALFLLLTGCTAWPDGYYVSVRPHAGEGPIQHQGISSVKNYNQLVAAIQNTVEDGASSITLSVEDYDQTILQSELNKAILTVHTQNPIAAYAVENIAYEFGVTGGVAAVSVTVGYNHNHGKISKMKISRNMDIAAGMIEDALESGSSELVLRIHGYKELDVVRLMQEHAAKYPELVMEVPQVTVNMYPESGSYRVLELLFAYQSSKDALKSMQEHVRQLFASSRLYIAGEEDETSRYDMLCTFLMERTTYKLETSLTPAYSLLRHGVGDSRAFAITYSAMCRNAGLECMTVSGTRAGEPWYWNIVCENGTYYHLDLLKSHGNGVYYRYTDEQMSGYVWDYSAYPVCGVVPEDEPVQSENTDVTEPTIPGNAAAK